jgi:copper chaperone
MQQTTLDVQGMSCGHCVKTIESKVGAMRGVEAVAVDLKGGKVQVRHAPETTAEAIIATIEDAGFEASAGR